MIESGNRLSDELMNRLKQAGFTSEEMKEFQEIMSTIFEENERFWNSYIESSDMYNENHEHEKNELSGKKLIKLELDKQDLISLAKGTSPNYSVMDNTLVKKYGSYTGGFKDEWNWEYDAFEKCSETEILEIYQLCKNSWK